MSTAPATAVPDESHWLCEGCGYVLEGLPPGVRCPECGKPTSESAGDLRAQPLWERPQDAGIFQRFAITTAQVLSGPSHFYRSLATRGSRERSAAFARIHWTIASILFGIAAWIHFDWSAIGSANVIGIVWPWWTAIILAAASYLFLTLSLALAARLTTWEATYRGIRLPLGVVRRGLDYHAAHYLPVALLAAATVVIFRLVLLHRPQWAMQYIYTLSAEVILAAIYLFLTYWKGMRNMMYASR
jgi:hypothetical protein